MARAHEELRTYENLLRPGVTGKPFRDRFDEVSAAVAIATNAPDGLAVRPLAHQILRALHVWKVEEGPDGRDWRTELDGLVDLAAAAGKSPADIMAHLLVIAGRFGPRSGNVDADLVRGELARFGVYVPARSTDFQRSATNTTINASDNSTVFNAQVMNFGILNLHDRSSTPGKESGTS
jgi:hypothetical protein